MKTMLQGRRLDVSGSNDRRKLEDDHPEAAPRPVHRRAKRRLKHLRGLAGELRTVPIVELTAGCGYWNCKVPIDGGFIDNPRTHPSIRRACIDYLLQAAVVLAERTALQPEARRTCATVFLPTLFDSEMTVFFTDEYFQRFIDRSGAMDDARWYQHWERLPDGRSLLQEWSLDYNLDELGFRFTERDTSFDPPWHDSGEVWLIGNLKSL